ncbi:MAG TPA: YbaL family putative K(+) efflux transporter [Steroidobacteraceae bacterium]|nr:YbaL family putative K(+) efflux transporter [Steroidobacteraceae bacterium]
MQHSTPLIATIAAGFGLAFLLGLVMHKLRLPAILGYLIAGVIIGPYSPGFVADSQLANQLAEIGVILLMFGVGLHFSLSDLMRVRAIAIPGAVAKIVVATAIGAFLGYLWGWHWSAGLVFGLSLSVASTVVLLRALEDHQLIRTQRAQIAIGWLIVEDLAMIVVLVLLPAFAEFHTPSSSGGPDFGAIALTLSITLGKVAIFVALMLLFGRRYLPKLLARAVRIRSRELFTLAVLAIALGIAYGSALLFDVSLALGAFFAGVVLSESELSHKAGEDILPMRDAFAVLFFVSVGMLFDPTILVREPMRVLAVVLVIVIGKSVAAFAIVLIAKHPLRTALLVTAGLAQIGEFSFILIALGVSLQLVPPDAQTLVLAGAIISIAINPLAFHALPGLELWLRSKPKLQAWLDRSSAVQNDARSVVPAEWSGHVVIVGHGRVGSVIASALHKHEIPYVVVEMDRKIVERLTAEGVRAVVGDIADAAVLTAVGLDRAAMLAFAIPDSLQLRHALETVRAANSALHILARTHSAEDRDFLRTAGVELALMSERELGLQMAHYALTNSGVERRASDQTIDELRTDA